MFTGQVIDLYTLDGRLQATLWLPQESRKRTIELREVEVEIFVGDVIRVHGAVDSNATIMAARDVPEDFSMILNQPQRQHSIVLELPSIGGESAAT